MYDIYILQRVHIYIYIYIIHIYSATYLGQSATPPGGDAGRRPGPNLILISGKDKGGPSNGGFLNDGLFPLE